MFKTFKKKIILEKLFKIYKTSQLFDLLVVDENYSKKKTKVILLQF